MSAPPESRDLKKIALVAAGGLVLVLPTVISFFAGGFFADARILGLVASWFAFLVVAIGDFANSKSTNAHRSISK